MEKQNQPIESIENPVVEVSPLEHNVHQIPQNSMPQQQIIINQTTPTTNSAPRNGVGTAGFIVALISLFFSWAPGFGWILWAVGLILSFIGMFKTPRGLAITGFILSLIDIILLVVVASAIATLWASIQ